MEQSSFCSTIGKTIINNFHLCCLYLVGSIYLTFPQAALFSFIYEQLGVIDPAIVQRYFATTFLMFNLKVFWAIFTDAVPIKGYRRCPYIIATSLMVSFGYLSMGLYVRNFYAQYAMGLITAFGIAFYMTTLDGLTIEVSGGILEKSYHLQISVRLFQYLGTLFAVGLSTSLSSRLNSRLILSLTAFWGLVGAIIGWSFPEKTYDQIKENLILFTDGVSDPMRENIQTLRCRDQARQPLIICSDYTTVTELCKDLSCEGDKVLEEGTREARAIEEPIALPEGQGADVSANQSFVAICWSGIKNHFSFLWNLAYKQATFQYSMLMLFLFLKGLIPVASTAMYTWIIATIPPTMTTFFPLFELSSPIFTPIGILLFWVLFVGLRSENLSATLKYSLISSTCLMMLVDFSSLALVLGWFSKIGFSTPAAIVTNEIVNSLVMPFGYLPLVLLCGINSNIITAAVSFAFLFSLQNLGQTFNGYISADLMESLKVSEDNNWSTLYIFILVCMLLKPIPLILLRWIDVNEIKSDLETPEAHT